MEGGVGDDGLRSFPIELGEWVAVEDGMATGIDEEATRAVGEDVEGAMVKGSEEVTRPMDVERARVTGREDSTRYMDFERNLVTVHDGKVRCHQIGAYEEESNHNMDHTRETETAVEIEVREKRDSDLLLGHEVHCGVEVMEPEDGGCCGCDHRALSHCYVDDFGDKPRYGYDNEHRHGDVLRPSSCSRMA